MESLQSGFQLEQLDVKTEFILLGLFRLLKFSDINVEPRFWASAALCA